MSIVTLLETLATERIHRLIVKLSNVALTAMDKHYIIWRNLYSIISILSQVFTREDVFAGESRKFAERGTRLTKR